MSETFEIITYGAGPYLVDVFNGIAAITQHGDYTILIDMIYLFGAMAVGYLAILRGQIGNFATWLAKFVLIYAVLFAPKVDVMITDRINGNLPSAVIKNVPFGVAGLAHFSSHVGDALTRAFEMVFSAPDDMKYHQTGMLMASSMIEKTAFLPMINEKFATNIRGFIHECVFYDAAKGIKYTWDDLKNSDDIWKLVSDGASNAYAFPYNNEILTCKEGATKLNADWKTEIANTNALYAKRYQKKLDEKGAANALFNSHLPNAYNYLLGISKTAEQTMHQQLMLYAMIDGVETLASEKGASAALQQFATARAKIQQHSSYAIVGQLALEKLPVMRAIFECLLYGIFPIAFLLMLLPTGHRFLMVYAGSLLWVHSWGPMFAILNVFFSFSAKMASTMAATSSAGVGVSLQTLPGLYDVNSKICTFAGFLASFIPILTWNIYKSGPGVLASMSQSLLGINQSSAMAAADEITTGNMRYGNADLGNRSFNNMNANKYDTNTSFRGGAMSVQGDDLVQYTVGQSGSVVADSHGAFSRLGAQVNATESVRRIAGEQASHAEQESQAANQTFEERVSEAQAAHEAFSQHVGRTWDASVSVSESGSVGFSRSARNSEDRSERDSKSDSETESEGKQGANSTFGRASISGGAKAFGFGLSGEAGKELSSRKYDDKSNSHVEQHSEDKLKNFSTATSGEISYRAVGERLNRVGDSEGASLAFRAEASRQEAVSAAASWQNTKSIADSWNSMKSLQDESGATLNVNWEQEMFKRVAKMPSPGQSNGEMGAYQAAQVLNNPGLSKEYVDKAVFTFLNEKVRDGK
jgi:conjugal transfer mating pair stabilization protein TraG